MKQVICIKWGTRYGPDYVNRLRAMVSRHLTPPFRFVCFTDVADGLDEGVEAQPLPALDCEMPTNTLGIWGKARLWSERLTDLEGPVLFLDLDAVVIGSLDAFFEIGAPDDLIVARNPATPLERLGQTSVYRMPVGKLAPLKAEFLADPQGIADRYRFEQRFVTRRAPGGVTFWPRGWVAHFRRHCVPTFPLNYIRPPAPPRGARIVIFPGSLNPPDAIAGRYHEAGEARGAADHLRASFDGRRTEGLLPHLRHFIHPSPWVAEHWR